MPFARPYLLKIPCRLRPGVVMLNDNLQDVSQLWRLQRKHICIVLHEVLNRQSMQAALQTWPKCGISSASFRLPVALFEPMIVRYTFAVVSAPSLLPWRSQHESNSGMHNITRKPVTTETLYPWTFSSALSAFLTLGGGGAALTTTGILSSIQHIKLL